MNGQGEKELLAMQPGYRESTASWAEVLRDLRDRGLNCPMVVIGDGALGIWVAAREVWPQARPQRCWNHRVLNVLDKLPKRLWPQVRKDLRLAATAPTCAICRERLERIAAELRQAGHEAAAETVLRDVEDFLTFYDFPQEHWQHLRTTNPIESTFATVRLRTARTKGSGSRTACLTMVFKLAQCAEKRWRRLNGQELIPEVIRGVKFVDGVKEIAA